MQMNDTLYIANNQWIVETHVPMWKDYEHLFDSDHPNLVEPGRSTTVNGYQIPHTLEAVSYTHLTLPTILRV